MTTNKSDWKKEINEHLKKYQEAIDAIFKAFENEVKKKGIKSVKEENKLWNEKYKAKFEKIEAKYDKEYERLWNKYYKIKRETIKNKNLKQKKSKK